MGTRSLTHIYDGDDKKPLVTFYRQMDGYPAGIGQELAGFLDGFTIVNGIGSERPKKLANGAGCLAAQVIKHMKDSVGSVYIYPAGSKDCGEEYTYHLRVHEGKPVQIEVKQVYGTPKSIFKGSPAKLLKFEEKDE